MSNNCHFERHKVTDRQLTGTMGAQVPVMTGKLDH